MKKKTTTAEEISRDLIGHTIPVGFRHRLESYKTTQNDVSRIDCGTGKVLSELDHRIKLQIFKST